MYRLRFFDDCGSGWLWGGDAVTLETFDVGLLDDLLPLSPATRAEAAALSDLHASTLNWDDPMNPQPLSPAFCDEFNRRAIALMAMMQADLGPQFHLQFQQAVLLPG